MLEARSSVDSSWGAHFPRPVLVACAGLPPIHGGTATIMKNLLSHLEPESVVLATARPSKRLQTLQMKPRHVRHYVLDQLALPGRIERFRRFLLKGVVARRLVRLAQRTGCGAVVGVYPDLVFLDASQKAAAQLGLPFLPYLHDTVAEAAATTSYAGWASDIQERVFSTAPAVFVATHGMAELYRGKYDLDVVSLVHIYPEKINSSRLDEPPKNNSLFWSGNVYSINATSVTRVCKAMERIEDLGFTIATGQSRSDLAEMGLTSDRIQTTYVPVDRRTEYLDLIADHQVLVLALNWPDETQVPFEELSTIFPTKAPEYLGSGRPVLVHCPEDYYLSRFFRSHGGAVIVNERSVDAVETALRQLLGSVEMQRELGRQAIRAAHEFSPDNVVPVFHGRVVKALEESGI